MIFFPQSRKDKTTVVFSYSADTTTVSNLIIDTAKVSFYMFDHGVVLDVGQTVNDITLEQAGKVCDQLLKALLKDSMELIQLVMQACKNK